MLTIGAVLGGNNILPPRPFLLHALKFCEKGIFTIPCDNKKPLVAWKKYQTSHFNFDAKEEAKKLIKKFPDANIGIITGELSNLTIIDCDNPNISVEELEMEFGVSNFIVSTPRGGKHLYYKYSGETSGIVREKIDIKAKGGLIIAPYSFNHDKKASYLIVKGDLDDLSKLTNLQSNCAQNKPRNDSFDNIKAGDSDLIIKEGQRNTYLFYQLKKIAKSHRSYESLEKVALDINHLLLNPPLANEEVINTAKNVWRYKVTGSLINENGGAFLTVDEMKKLEKNPRAVLLLWNLKFYHDGMNRWFCIDQVKTAKKLNWNRKTLRQAIDVLVKNELLIRQKNEGKKTFRDNKIKTLPYKYGSVPKILNTFSLLKLIKNHA